MNIKCAVACVNAEGSPDLFLVTVTVTSDQYQDGMHYDIAKDICSDEGHEPKLVIDENDAGFCLIDQTAIDWSSELAI